MAINWMNDLGAPAVVTAIDLTVESVAAERAEIASYVLAGGSWLAVALGWARGDFVKNIAIAASPLAMRNIYEKARGITSSPVRRLSMQKVSRWPAPLVEEPFGGARLT